MPTIKLYHSARHPNFGDAACPLLIERLFNCKVVHAHYRDAELFAIGSILGKIAPDRHNFLKSLLKPLLPEIMVWGSGFMYPPKAGVVPVRRFKVAALRGERSKAELERVTGMHFQVPTGDAGLLFNRLLDAPVEKKYTLGVIPHYRELGMAEYERIAAAVPGAKIISVLDPVEKIIREIAECETVVSSSLHGLIAADALNVPNRRLRHSGKVRGGDFKYDDYYSAFPVSPGAPLELDDAVKNPPSPAEIVEKYKITQSMVDEIRAGLIAAWPFK